MQRKSSYSTLVPANHLGDAIEFSLTEFKKNAFFLFHVIFFRKFSLHKGQKSAFKKIKFELFCYVSK